MSVLPLTGNKFKFYCYHEAYAHVDLHVRKCDRSDSIPSLLKRIHKRIFNFSFNCSKIKGSSYQSNFLFEINVGKRRIRHITTLNLNDVNLNRIWVNLEIFHSNSECHSKSDPSISDIYFKN